MAFRTVLMAASFRPLPPHQRAPLLTWQGCPSADMAGLPLGCHGRSVPLLPRQGCPSADTAATHTETSLAAPLAAARRHPFLLLPRRHCRRRRRHCRRRRHRPYRPGMACRHWRCPHLALPPAPLLLLLLPLLMPPPQPLPQPQLPQRRRWWWWCCCCCCRCRCRHCRSVGHLSPPPSMPPIPLHPPPHPWPPPLPPPPPPPPPSAQPPNALYPPPPHTTLTRPMLPAAPLRAAHRPLPRGEPPTTPPSSVEKERAGRWGSRGLEFGELLNTKPSAYIGTRGGMALGELSGSGGPAMSPHLGWCRLWHDMHGGRLGLLMRSCCCPACAPAQPLSPPPSPLQPPCHRPGHCHCRGRCRHGLRHGEPSRGRRPLRHRPLPVDPGRPRRPTPLQLHHPPPVHRLPPPGCGHLHHHRHRFLPQRGGLGPLPPSVGGCPGVRRPLPHLGHVPGPLHHLRLRILCPRLLLLVLPLRGDPGRV